MIIPQHLINELTFGRAILFLGAGVTQQINLA
jgi:hypothetical protein